MIITYPPKTRSVLLKLSALVVAMLAFPMSVSAEEIESSMARGGELYDKWYKVIDAKAPAEKHPTYPASGKYASKPGTTWRCKECHGWDYEGKDGAYSKGKHHTGIKGIQGMAGATSDKIIAVLKDPKHGYGKKLSATDLTDLANFVSKGQVDTDKYIDRVSKQPKGDKAKGEGYYNTICAKCHSKDGTEPDDMSKTLGALMSNPWEVMHKIMNGQPDEEMPSLRALDTQVIVDILAHMTTLPKKKK
ncbi:c-type cytochrome [Pseudomonadota bacterium]